MKQRNLLRYAKLGPYALGLIIFLELASSLVLNNLVSSERMERFDTLFLMDPIEYDFVPHPYLGWVGPHYLEEQERYLSYFGENRTDTVYIVAMGGSTTWTGYPAHTEHYLNDKLKRLNSSLRVVVFNFGVNGWNSLQSTKNYFYLLRYLHPDVVIIHENTNDRSLRKEAFRQSVLQFPEISQTERVLLRNSRFYKLVRFAYFQSYNPLRYGTGVVYGDEPELPMQARISSYLNEVGFRVWMADCFRIRFGPELALPIEMTSEFLLTENYETLIKYTRADNSTLIMTTQYLNYSKEQPGPDINELESWERDSHDINNILRNVSRQHNVPLVDLDAEMAPFDYLLTDDGVHWNDEGIKLKGELIGETIFEILKERYGLSS